MKRHLQCAEQQESQSNCTKYCACPTKWISCLIRVTSGTSFTMRGATLVTMQHHQILRLPRNSEFKMSAETPWIVSANIKTIRPDSDDNPTISDHIRTQNRHLAPAASETLPVPSWTGILYWKIQHFTLRLSIQISRTAAPATKCNTPTSWNTAAATKSQTPTAPNTAPATQNASHDWSAALMERHLQCAEQHWLPCNITKYCACHEILSSRCQRKLPEPAPQNEYHAWSASLMERHLQCAEQHWLPCNITKYCACHEILSSRCQRKLPELFPPI